jgi:MFS family permease
MTAIDTPLVRAAAHNWQIPGRELTAYPSARARNGYLGLTVLITVTLYYLVSCGNSVIILQMADLNISFHYLLWTLAVGNLIGAVGAWFAGLTDRIGRVTTIIFGLTVGSLLVLFAIPASPNRWIFATLTLLLGNIEGVVLVATPALMRDFSPQSDRGSAMGFWTLGPVFGALITSAVGTLTIHGTPVASFWGHEYVIAGIAGVVVSVIAIVFLKELSPELRDQILVSEADQHLAEVHAKGIDVEAALQNPWRQMLKADILVSGFAVSILLIAFYSAIAIGLISFVVVFGFDLHHANMLANWMWAANAVAVIATGFLSDRLAVRKPFMAIGAVITGTGIVIYLEHFTHHASFAVTAVMAATITFGLGVAFTPWLANFTETVEAHNPALAATGLATWGLTLRIVTFFALGLLPVVVSSMTPVVNFVVKTTPYTNDLIFAGAHPELTTFAQQNTSQIVALETLAAQNPTQLAQLNANGANIQTLTKFKDEVNGIAAHPALFQKLAANPFDKTLDGQAVQALGGGALGQERFNTIIANSSTLVPALTWAQAHPDVIAFAQAHAALLTWAQQNQQMLTLLQKNAATLQALQHLPAPITKYVLTNGAKATQAEHDIPPQLQHWYWICLSGPVLFLLSTPLLKGRWSPRKAREDLEAHRAAVAAEEAQLSAV